MPVLHAKEQGAVVRPFFMQKKELVICQLFLCLRVPRLRSFFLSMWVAGRLYVSICLATGLPLSVWLVLLIACSMIDVPKRPLGDDLLDAVSSRFAACVRSSTDSLFGGAGLLSKALIIFHYLWVIQEIDGAKLNFWPISHGASFLFLKWVVSGLQY